MSDTTRTVLIALGIALLVVGLLPFLFMGGMMGSMMGGPGGMMPGLGIGLVLLVIVAGLVFLVVGLRRR